jgi:hypothetical protein
MPFDAMPEFTGLIEGAIGVRFLNTLDDIESHV